MNRITFTAIAILSATAAFASSPPADSVVTPLNEVVVTGSNAAVEAKLLPYTVSVIGERELAASANTQLLSVLSGRVPSLFVTEKGFLGFGVGSNGGSGHIKLRGVGGDRASAVLLMVDGQPQFAGIYSHSIPDFYGKDYVQRVEVLRGPGSVLYGSNAMAGVINVITKNATREGVHGTVSTQYGSYNTSLTSASATARYGRFSALADVTFDRSDGNIEHMDFTRWGAYAKVGYDLSDRWNLGADYTFADFRGNDPVYATLSNPESTDIYHQHIIRGEASMAASNRYDNTNGVIRAYYSYGNHFIDDPRHFHSTDDRFGVMLYQNFHPADMSDITFGFDFDTYSGRIPVSGGNNHRPGSLATMSRRSITEYSPYLTISQGALQRQIVVTLGLRMANSTKFGTHWIPQVGASWSPEGLFTLKASAAMGYRNPSFRELYLYKMANPDLDPENMYNYEVSLSRNFSSRLSASLTAYFSRGSNMIQVVDMKNVNTGSFINKGIEATVTYYPVDPLVLTASYSYLRTNLHNLTGAPKNQLFIGADWNAFRGFSVSADFRLIGGLYVAPQIKNQNYALLNLKASYDFCRFAGVFLRIDNVTDTQYVINRGYDMPGFSILGGVKFRF